MCVHTPLVGVGSLQPLKAVEWEVSPIEWPSHWLGLRRSGDAQVPLWPGQFFTDYTLAFSMLRASRGNGL